MEEKNLNHDENLKNSEKTVEQKSEMSVADRILQRIQEKKGMTAEDGNKDEKITKNLKSEEPKPQTENSQKENIKAENVEKTTELTEEKAEKISSETQKEEQKQEPENSEENSPKKEDKKPAKKSYTIPDFSEMDKNQLLAQMQEYVNAEDTLLVSKAVYTLKGVFYSKINEEKAAAREKFIADGGDARDFKPEPDEIELKFAEAYKAYMAKKEAEQERVNKEMEANLNAKLDIIKSIESLVNKPEAFGETYNEFRALQDKWNTIGLIAKDKVKEVWDEYNRVVEKFFSYIKINKELRDLDLKKNLNMKLELCEKAEELLLEPKIAKAHAKLQDLHDRWREIGPAVFEKKEEIWERFKAATIQINTKFQEHIDKIREQQEKNLEAKTFLCEKVEEIAQGEYTTRKEWKAASDQVIKIQGLWKGIGFVPKKHNKQIYDRFRAGCDAFFARIREFYDKADAERMENLQKKTDLCVQAESMTESTEWRKTTDFYIKLQQTWKEIGPVPAKYSDKIWKRFRKACNTFFEAKNEFYNSRKTAEQDNLKAKQDLIEKIKQVDTKSDKSKAIEALKAYQKEWTQIGHVPYDKKDTIYKEYRDLLDAKFGEMNMDAKHASELKFNDKLTAFKDASNSEELIDNEIGNLRRKIEKLEGDIKVWENNLGFFANTKNAENMLKDFKKKIERSKQQVAEYRKQIKQLSELQ